jgi:two-component system phosphate regulon sensor histidine kinase PhoR
MENALASLDEEYETLVACCEAGIVILNGEDVIVRANMAARPLFARSLSRVLGKTLHQATQSAELVELAHEARAARSLCRREIRLSGSGGVILRVAIAPVAGDDPDSSRLVLVADDVTELRRLETIRRDFVANVSHELRTPLASIRAMTETLQDGALQDPSVAYHFLATINNEAQRLTRISEDLLILSQAESRQPEKTSFLLAGLLQEAVSRFQPQAEKAGVELAAVLPADLEVFANHDQIEQVIVNLLDNALKYTPAGGKACVTAENRAKQVAVHVSDTGIGIMSQDVPRIFERFYRVDKARSRQSGGTGLGLSIVKHIIEAHGGQVTVKSDYGHGSTFTFTLPHPR